MTRRAVLLVFALLASFCAGGRGKIGNNAATGHGAISIDVVPNPVVATKVAGTTYDFPFEVVVHETGGRPIDVTSVTATVFALGGIEIASESYDAAKINTLGFSTHVPANGELHYRFDQRRDVRDGRLFHGVAAHIVVEAHDDSGAPATASTNVTVTKG